MRLAERDHVPADRVFRLLAGRPRFCWGRNGEALLRKHKPWWFCHPPLPRTVVISDRLAPYVGADPCSGPAAGDPDGYRGGVGSRL